MGDEGAQPAQNQMLDEFMEKYGLQDQDWRKQMKPKQYSPNSVVANRAIHGTSGAWST